MKIKNPDDAALKQRLTALQYQVTQRAVSYTHLTLPTNREV